MKNKKIRYISILSVMFTLFSYIISGFLITRNKKIENVLADAITQSEETITISSEEEWNSFVHDNPNFGGVVNIMGDLTFNYDNDIFEQFSGELNGNGYSITGANMLMNVNNGYIYNLVLKDSHVTQYYNYGSWEIIAGAVCGVNNKHIIGVGVEGAEIIFNGTNLDYTTVGGITGINYGTIQDCYVYNSDIEAYNGSEPNEVYWNNLAGGITGYLTGGAIRNCILAGNTVLSNGLGEYEYTSQMSMIQFPMFDDIFCAYTANTTKPVDGYYDDIMYNSLITSEKATVDSIWIDKIRAPHNSLSNRYINLQSRLLGGGNSGLGSLEISNIYTYGQETRFDFDSLKENVNDLAYDMPSGSVNELYVADVAELEEKTPFLDERFIKTDSQTKDYTFVMEHELLGIKSDVNDDPAIAGLDYKDYEISGIIFQVEEIENPIFIYHGSGCQEKNLFCLKISKSPLGSEWTGVYHFTPYCLDTVENRSKITGVSEFNILSTFYTTGAYYSGADLLENVDVYDDNNNLRELYYYTNSAYGIPTAEYMRAVNNERINFDDTSVHHFTNSETVTYYRYNTDIITSGINIGELKITVAQPSWIQSTDQLFKPNTSPNVNNITVSKQQPTDTDFSISKITTNDGWFKYQVTSDGKYELGYPFISNKYGDSFNLAIKYYNTDHWKNNGATGSDGAYKIDSSWFTNEYHVVEDPGINILYTTQVSSEFFTESRTNKMQEVKSYTLNEKTYTLRGYRLTGSYTNLIDYNSSTATFSWNFKNDIFKDNKFDAQKVTSSTLNVYPVYEEVGINISFEYLRKNNHTANDNAISTTLTQKKTKGTITTVSGLGDFDGCFDKEDFDNSALGKITLTPSELEASKYTFDVKFKGDYEEGRKYYIGVTLNRVGDGGISNDILSNKTTFETSNISFEGMYLFNGGKDQISIVFSNYDILTITDLLKGTTSNPEYLISIYVYEMMDVQVYNMTPSTADAYKDEEKYPTFSQKQSTLHILYGTNVFYKEDLSARAGSDPLEIGQMLKDNKVNLTLDGYFTSDPDKNGSFLEDSIQVLTPSFSCYNQDSNDYWDSNGNWVYKEVAYLTAKYTGLSGTYYVNFQFLYGKLTYSKATPTMTVKVLYGVDNSYLADVTPVAPGQNNHGLKITYPTMEDFEQMEEGKIWRTKIELYDFDKKEVLFIAATATTYISDFKFNFLIENTKTSFEYILYQAKEVENDSAKRDRTNAKLYSDSTEYSYKLDCKLVSEKDKNNEATIKIIWYIDELVQLNDYYNNTVTIARIVEGSDYCYKITNYPTSSNFLGYYYDSEFKYGAVIKSKYTPYLDYGNDVNLKINNYGIAYIYPKSGAYVVRYHIDVDETGMSVDKYRTSPTYSNCWSNSGNTYVFQYATIYGSSKLYIPELTVKTKANGDSLIGYKINTTQYSSYYTLTGIKLDKLSNGETRTFNMTSIEGAEVVEAIVIDVYEVWGKLQQFQIVCHSVADEEWYNMSELTYENDIYPDYRDYSTFAYITPFGDEYVKIPIPNDVDAIRREAGLDENAELLGYNLHESGSSTVEYTKAELKSTYISNLYGNMEILDVDEYFTIHIYEVWGVEATTNYKVVYHAYATDHGYEGVDPYNYNVTIGEITYNSRSWDVAYYSEETIYFYTSDNANELVRIPQFQKKYDIKPKGYNLNSPTGSANYTWDTITAYTLKELKNYSSIEAGKRVIHIYEIWGEKGQVQIVFNMYWKNGDTYEYLINQTKYVQTVGGVPVDYDESVYPTIFTKDGVNYIPLILFDAGDWASVSTTYSILGEYAANQLLETKKYFYIYNDHISFRSYEDISFPSSNGTLTYHVYGRASKYVNKSENKEFYSYTNMYVGYYEGSFSLYQQSEKYYLSTLDPELIDYTNLITDYYGKYLNGVDEQYILNYDKKFFIPVHYLIKHTWTEYQHEEGAEWTDHKYNTWSIGGGNIFDGILDSLFAEPGSGYYTDKEIAKDLYETSRITGHRYSYQSINFVTSKEYKKLEDKFSQKEYTTGYTIITRDALEDLLTFKEEYANTTNNFAEDFDYLVSSLSAKYNLSSEIVSELLLVKPHRYKFSGFTTCVYSENWINSYPKFDGAIIPEPGYVALNYTAGFDKYYSFYSSRINWEPEEFSITFDFQGKKIIFNYTSTYVAGLEKVQIYQGPNIGELFKETMKEMGYANSNLAYLYIKDYNVKPMYVDEGYYYSDKNKTEDFFNDLTKTVRKTTYNYLGEIISIRYEYSEHLTLDYGTYGNITYYLDFKPVNYALAFNEIGEEDKLFNSDLFEFDEYTYKDILNNDKEVTKNVSVLTNLYGESINSYSIINLLDLLNEQYKNKPLENADGTMYLAGWTFLPMLYVGEDFECLDEEMNDYYYTKGVSIYGLEFLVSEYDNDLYSWEAHINDMLQYYGVYSYTDGILRNYNNKFYKNLNCFTTEALLKFTNQSILYDGQISYLYGLPSGHHYYNYNGLVTVNLYPLWLPYNTIELSIGKNPSLPSNRNQPTTSSIYDENGNLVSGGVVTLKYGITLQDSLKLYYNPVAGLTNQPTKLDGYSYSCFGYKLAGFTFRQYTYVDRWGQDYTAYYVDKFQSVSMPYYKDYLYTDIRRQGDVEYIDLYNIIKKLNLYEYDENDDYIYYIDELGEFPKLIVYAYWEEATINVEVDPNVGYVDGEFINSSNTVIKLNDSTQNVEVPVINNHSLYKLTHNGNELGLLSADNLNGYSVVDDDQIRLTGLLSWINDIKDKANLKVVVDKNGRLIPSITFDAEYAGNLYIIEVEGVSSDVTIASDSDATGTNLGTLQLKHGSILTKSGNSTLYEALKGKAIKDGNKIYLCLVYNQEVYDKLTSVLPLLFRDGYELDYYYALGSDSKGYTNAYDIASKSVINEGVSKYVEGKDFVFPNYWTDTENKLNASWLRDSYYANIDLGVLLRQETDSPTSNAYLIAKVSEETSNTYYVIKYNGDSYSKYTLTEEKYNSWDKTYKGLSSLKLTATTGAIVSVPKGSTISIECIDQVKDVSIDAFIGYRNIGFSMQPSELGEGDIENFPLNTFTTIENVTSSYSNGVLSIQIGEISEHIDFKVRAIIEKIKYSIVIKTDDTNSTITANGETGTFITISNLTIGQAVTATFNEGEKREIVKWVYSVNGIDTDFDFDVNLSFEINAEFLKAYLYKNLTKYPANETQDLGEMIAISETVPFKLTLNLQTLLDNKNCKNGYILVESSGTYFLVEFNDSQYNAWLINDNKVNELTTNGIDKFLQDNSSLVNRSTQSSTATIEFNAVAGAKINLTFFDQSKDVSNNLIGFKLNSISVKNYGWLQSETYDGIIDSTSKVNTTDNYDLVYSNSSIYNWIIDISNITQDLEINLSANYEKLTYTLYVFTNVDGGTITNQTGENVKTATYTFNIDDQITVTYNPTDADHELYQWIFTPENKTANVWAEYINPLTKTIDASIILGYWTKNSDSSFYTNFNTNLGTLEATERQKPESFRVNLDVRVLLQTDSEEDSENSFVAVKRGDVYYIIRYVNGGYKYNTTNDLNNISFNLTEAYTSETIQLEPNTNIEIYFFDQSKNNSQDEFIGYRLNGVKISEGASVTEYGVSDTISSNNALNNITYTRNDDLYKLTIEIGDLVEEQDGQTLTISELITPIKYTLTLKSNNSSFGNIEANGQTGAEVKLTNLSVLDSETLDNLVEATATANEHYEFINWMYAINTGATEEEYSKDPNLELRIDASANSLIRALYKRLESYPVDDQDLGVLTAYFEKIRYRVEIDVQVLLDNLNSNNAYLVAEIDSSYYVIKCVNEKYVYEVFENISEIDVTNLTKSFNANVLSVYSNSEIKITVYDQSKDSSDDNFIGYKLKGFEIVRPTELVASAPFNPYLVEQNAVEEIDQERSITYSANGYTVKITTGELTNNHSVKVRAILERINYTITIRTVNETGKETGVVEASYTGKPKDVSYSGINTRLANGTYNLIEAIATVDSKINATYTSIGWYELDYWEYSKNASNKIDGNPIEFTLDATYLRNYAYDNGIFSVEPKDLGVYEAFANEQEKYYTVNLDLALVLRENGVDKASDNGYILAKHSSSKYYALIYSTDESVYKLYELTEIQYNNFELSILSDLTPEIQTIIQVPSNSSMEIRVFDQSKDASEDKYIGYRFKGFILNGPDEAVNGEYLNDENPIVLNETINLMTYETQDNGYTFSIAIGNRTGNTANAFEDMKYTAILEKINYKLTYNVDEKTGNINVGNYHNVTSQTFDKLLVNESIHSSYNPSLGYEIDNWNFESIVLETLKSYTKENTCLATDVGIDITINANFLRTYIYKNNVYPADLNQDLGIISAIAKLIKFELEVKIQKETGAELLTYTLSAPESSLVDLSYNGVSKTYLTLNEDNYLISLNPTTKSGYKCYEQSGTDYAILSMYIQGTATTFENKNYDFPTDNYESISIKIDQDMLMHLVRYSLGVAVTEENRVINLVINVAEIFEITVVDDEKLATVDENNYLKGERSLLVRDVIVAHGSDGEQVKQTGNIVYGYLGQEVKVSVNNFSISHYSKAIIADATETAEPFETKELTPNQSFDLEVKNDTVLSVEFVVREYSLNCEILYDGRYYSLDNYSNIEVSAGTPMLTTKPILKVYKEGTTTERLTKFYYGDNIELTFGDSNFNNDLLDDGKLKDYSYVIKVNGKVLKGTNSVYTTNFTNDLQMVIEILDINGIVYISNNMDNVGDVVIVTSSSTYSITNDQITIELQPNEKVTAYIKTKLGYAFDTTIFNGSAQTVPETTTVTEGAYVGYQTFDLIDSYTSVKQGIYILNFVEKEVSIDLRYYVNGVEDTNAGAGYTAEPSTLKVTGTTVITKGTDNKGYRFIGYSIGGPIGEEDISVIEGADQNTIVVSDYIDYIQQDIDGNLVLKVYINYIRQYTITVNAINGNLGTNISITDSNSNRVVGVNNPKELPKTTDYYDQFNEEDPVYYTLSVKSANENYYFKLKVNDKEINDDVLETVAEEDEENLGLQTDSIIKTPNYNFAEIEYIFKLDQNYIIEVAYSRESYKTQLTEYLVQTTNELDNFNTSVSMPRIITDNIDVVGNGNVTALTNDVVLNFTSSSKNEFNTSQTMNISIDADKRNYEIYQIKINGNVQELKIIYDEVEKKNKMTLNYVVENMLEKDNQHDTPYMHVEIIYREVYSVVVTV